MARALAAGVPVLVCPPAGDMAENGARVAWSGAGLMLPHRLLGADGAATQPRARCWRTNRSSRGRGELAAWAREQRRRRDGGRRSSNGLRRRGEAGMRVMVGAIGLAGHSLPAIALARELRERGHEVRFHGFERWRDDGRGLGLAFDGRRGRDRQRRSAGRQPSLAETARALAASIAEFGPDVVVSDALTLAPGAGRRGRRRSRE